MIIRYRLEHERITNPSGFLFVCIHIPIHFQILSLLIVPPRLPIAFFIRYELKYRKIKTVIHYAIPSKIIQ